MGVIKTEGNIGLRDKSARNLLTGQAVTGIKRA
jgi:hypothetical protein